MNVAKIFKKEFKEAKKIIDKYDNIIIFRHARPDFDAMGSQFGMYTWLKESFPGKNIYVTGSNFDQFVDTLYPNIKPLDDSVFEQEFLAIILDTGNSSRIDDQRYQKAKYIIKFDHHPNDEPYGNLNIVANELSSACELVSNFCFAFEKKYPLSNLACKYLYSGIIGDTGRFLFSSVDSDTLITSAHLIKNGLVPSYDVYEKMYEKDIESLKLQRYVLDNMHVSEKGVAYYILLDKDLKELGISSDRGKEYLSLMSNIKNIPIWFSLTEYKEKNEYRISLRSKRLDISKVANKYHGGGHLNASGATLYSLDELDSLIHDLEELISA